MKPYALSKALAISAGAGFLAALPVVLSITASINVLDILFIPFVAICPPWELFWALMGKSEDAEAAMRIGLKVLAINSVLYIPLGFIYASLIMRSRTVRWSVLAVAYIVLMGLAHWYFVLRLVT